MHGDYISDIAQAILRSRQYSQTRVLIAHEVLLPKGIRDLRKLNLKTRLPVISIVTSKTGNLSAGKSGTSPSFDIKIGKRHVAVQTLQLDKEAAHEIFLVGCKENSLVPEALRIAELTATALQKLR